MSVQETLKKIQELGVVLVVRAKDGKQALSGIRAVVEGGLKAVEITYTVPGAGDVIRLVKKELGDKVLLGAGTVTTVDQANDAVNAGATYLVAPNTDERVIKEAKKLGVPIMPGAYTPTEVCRAWDLGGDVIKIFPASVGGPAYIKALKGPFPKIPMMPTGGVDEKTVGEFFKAGAVAVGAGGSLFDPKRLEAEDWQGMTEAAAKFIAVLNAVRK
jgi:2-dehydro-3-deoxyphosphogluconate aldolase/(4S)-4-hydroxy-2-oxoglutarate aldolase